MQAQVRIDILKVCEAGPHSSAEITEALGHKQLSGNIHKALPYLRNKGYLEYTMPEKPNSRLQKYRLTLNGQELLKIEQKSK